MSHGLLVQVAYTVCLLVYLVIVVNFSLLSPLVAFSCI